MLLSVSVTEIGSSMASIIEHFGRHPSVTSSSPLSVVCLVIISIILFGDCGAHP